MSLCLFSIGVLRLCVAGSVVFPACCVSLYLWLCAYVPLCLVMLTEQMATLMLVMSAHNLLKVLLFYCNVCNSDNISVVVVLYVGIV